MSEALIGGPVFAQQLLPLVLYCGFNSFSQPPPTPGAIGISAQVRLAHSGRPHEENSLHQVLAHRSSGTAGTIVHGCYRVPMDHAGIERHSGFNGRSPRSGASAFRRLSQEQAHPTAYCIGSTHATCEFTELKPASLPAVASCSHPVRSVIVASRRQIRPQTPHASEAGSPRRKLNSLGGVANVSAHQLLAGRQGKCGNELGGDWFSW